MSVGGEVSAHDFPIMAQEPLTDIVRRQQQEEKMTQQLMPKTPVNRYVANIYFLNLFFMYFFVLFFINVIYNCIEWWCVPENVWSDSDRRAII